MELKEYLKTKNCHKIILGAGNKNLTQIKNLAILYIKAGFRLFDVNAGKDSINAIKEAIKYTKKDDIYIMASVAVDDDIHLDKYQIDEKLCKKCSKCEKICPQGAIKDFKINEKYCIGCKKCHKTCNAIYKKHKKTDFNKTLDEIIKEGIDAIEFHISTKKEKEIIKKWKIINEKFANPKSICISRDKMSDEKIISILKELKNLSNSDIFMVQADGRAISGDNCEYKSNLQALAIGEMIERENLTDYLFLSGGINAKSMELVKKFDINIKGLSIGSYARKIVSKYTKDEDFLYNKEKFNEALEIAKKFHTSLR